MALPDGNIPWPPPHLTPALEAMHTWDTWWSGDTDRLTALYGGGSAAGPDPKRLQFAGGVAGRLARWWWGTPTAPGEQRKKLHVPIAGDLCGGSADLLFSEPPKLTVDDDPTQERLDDLLGDGMLATLQTGAEVGSALGGVYLRPVYDTELADAPWLDAVHADRAVPEWRWGRLAAVTFWREVHIDDRGGEVWRHLERHEPGRVLHGLYKGTRAKLGMPMALPDHPDTEQLAASVDADGAIATPHKGLAPSYVPNQVSRRWRSDRALQHLGRSDLDGVEHLMDALDETYSSWMRDIRLGKGRIHVPSVYLQAQGPGRGASWNPDQEAYAELNMLNPDGAALTVSQFQIRVAEHRDTAEDLIAQILRSAGYSGQTFGLGGDAAVTATEVTARERRSMTTRGRKILRWRPALAEQVQRLLEVDAAVFGTRVTAQRPTVEFEDSVQEDPLTLANTVETLRRAEAASTQTLVRMQHPDWEDADILAEADRILAESGRIVADPFETGAEGLLGLPEGEGA